MGKIALIAERNFNRMSGDLTIPPLLSTNRKRNCCFSSISVKESRLLISPKKHSAGSVSVPLDPARKESEANGNDTVYRREDEHQLTL